MCLSWEGVYVQRRLPYCETHSVASETLDKETVNVVMSSPETEHRHWWKSSHVTFSANNCFPRHWMLPTIS